MWRTPLVGFADASDPGFAALREIVDTAHELPGDVLPDARTVVAYFIPFSEEIVRSNAGEGLSSPLWALAYEETNAMLVRLKDRLIACFAAGGCRAAVSREAAVFDREKIVSRWSQRHIARLAGLGTFGLNNMLITQAGCCGRFGSVVTELELAPDTLPHGENCLYKKDGTCKACVRKCPSGALTAGGFDRHRCYAQCMENARLYTGFGNSYASEAGGEVTASGSEVCGKCLVGLPCSVKIP
jgi:epoxyqueuosine reductase QueG